MSKQEWAAFSALDLEETLERLIKDKQADLDRVLAQLNEYERRLSNQSKLIGERTRERDEARAELERRGLTMGSDLREDRAEVERLRDELRKLIVENERLSQTAVPPSQCEPVKQGIRYPNLFAAARKTMAYALATDPGLFESYEANVAMLLSDRYGFRVPQIRNQAAKDILKLIFEG